MGYRTNEQLGEEIARLRTANGLSQPELGEAIGLDQPAISRIENGQRGISARELLALARALEVTPEQLLEEDALALSWRADADDAATREAVEIFNSVIADYLAFETVGG